MTEVMLVELLVALHILGVVIEGDVSQKPSWVSGRWYNSHKEKKRKSLCSWALQQEPLHPTQPKTPAPEQQSASNQQPSLTRLTKSFAFITAGQLETACLFCNLPSMPLYDNLLS